MVCVLVSALALAACCLGKSISQCQPPARVPQTASTGRRVSAPPPGAGHLNLWALKAPSGGRPGRLDCQEWRTIRIGTYFCSFGIPATWNIATPQDMNRGRARVASPPGRPDIRFIAYPFGIYDRSLETELPKVFDALLPAGHNARSVGLLRSERIQVGERRATRLQRRFAFQERPGYWQIVGTYVEARPKCFALILMVPERDVTEVLPIYERIVQTFRHHSPEGATTPATAEGETEGGLSP